MPHICFLQDALYDPDGRNWTGSHLQCYLLANGLRDAGLKVSLIVTTSRERQQVPDVYQGINVHQVRVNVHAPFVDGFMKVNRQLRLLSPDFVYTRGRNWLAALAARYAHNHGARVVWASNNENGCGRWKFSQKALTTPRSWPRRLLRLGLGFIEDVLYAHGIRRSHVHVNQTERQRRLLAETFGLDGDVVASIQEVPEPPFDKADAPLVLWVGYFAPDKAPHHFLRLAAACKHLSYRFLMVGASSNRVEVTTDLRLARENSNFTYMDKQPRARLLELAEQAWLLVNTSGPTGDGIPNAMIEAWLREVPVLSLNFDPDGLLSRHGLGVVAHDPAELEKKLHEMIADREALRRMGRQARETAIELFSAEKIIKQYLTLMKITTQKTATAHEKASAALG